MANRAELRDEEQVQLLLGRPSSTFAECFLGRDRTVQEAVADKQGRHSRDRMRYWVRRFLDAGLLRQTGTRTGGHRPAPVYRLVADEFIVTGRLAYVYATQPDGIAQAERDMMGYVQRAVNLHLERLGDDLAVRFHRPSEQYAHTEILTVGELSGGPPSGGFSVQDTWLRTRLPRHRAREFITRLRELEAEIRAASEEAEGQPLDTAPFYVGHLSLVEDLD